MVNKGSVSGSQVILNHSNYAHYVRGKSVLVAQGGGQSGIFTAGVLDAFLLANFDPFDLFYGTSSGALTICVYLCRQHGLSRSFILDLTTDPHFFDLFRYIRRKQSMDLDWALDKVRRYPYKLDLDLGKKNLGERRAYATVTDAELIVDRYLPMLMPDWYDVLRATCAIPGLYSGSVLVDGVSYVDGGVTAAIPVQEAWRKGGRNIVVIRTDISCTDELPAGLSDQGRGTSRVTERLSEHVSRFKKEWQGFWRDQIEKAKQKKNDSAQLQRLNGGRWLFGAADIYRLSNLIGNNFDLGLADYLAVHFQTYSLTQSFLLSPPDDCFVFQICPSQPLKSGALLSKREDLLFDYQQGVEAGERFIQEYHIALSLCRQRNPLNLRGLVG